MRFHLLGLVLMAGVAIPAHAQRAETIDKRVDRIEQELRAVQRKVFPGANVPYVAGEIQAPPPSTVPTGVPATNAVADLTARVDALETQLRAITNQVEQNANQWRLLSQEIAELKAATSSRLDTLEKAGAPTAPAEAETAQASPPPVRGTPPRAQPSRPAPAPARVESVNDGDAPASAAAAGDSDAAAEEAYNAGFRLWSTKHYAEAQKALVEVGRKYPNSKWASYANNLAGRAYLDDGKPVQAARVLLANYQNNPKGERAPDSLFYVGQALMAVGKPDAACKAYDELQDVYGRSLRGELKQRLPAARAEAKCR